MAAPQRFEMAIAAPDLSVHEAIARRRATRAFTGERIARETIHALLAAAVRAPTAMHEEPWEFVIVQDRSVLKHLSDDAKKALNHAGGNARGLHRLSGLVAPENIFYDAGTLIVIYGKPMGQFVVADCWLAAENLMLAACEMGLGTCVIGLAVPALNTEKWKAAFNVPRELTAYAPMIVGVARGETPATTRDEPRILAWLTES